MRIGISNKCGAHCTLGANIFLFYDSTNVQKDIYFMPLLIIQIRPYELSFFQVFEPHKFQNMKKCVELICYGALYGGN